MNTVCELNRCSGCMACVDVCPKGAVKILDDLTAYNAVISEEKCVDCGVCHKVCQENHMPQAIKLLLLIIVRQTIHLIRLDRN